MKMEYMLFIIDIIGTIAFAFSGAMTAIRKEMDILGVMILGMVTAVAGLSGILFWELCRRRHLQNRFLR